MAEGSSVASSRNRSAGQVIVIFAGAMLVMTLMMAVVIDLSWLWSSALKVQRAADAAALAGAVALPNEPGTANMLALREAKRNGYVPGGGVVVTPSYDALVNPYRLNVRITAPVGMFFMRVVGLSSFDVTRTSHAEYNRPLKMGSPEQWYGVGTFDKVKATQQPDVPGPIQDTGWSPASAQLAGDWTNPDQADDQDDDNYAISTSLDGSVQQWGSFGLTTTAPNPIPTGAVIEGIEVRYRALLTGTDSPISNCAIQTNLSWNDGATWTTLATNEKLTTTESLHTIGSATSLAGWPRSAGTWAFSSFTNANFRARLTWNKLACGTNRTASVDTLEVRVTYHEMVPGPITYSAEPDVPVPTPPGETVAPTSQGFWGAIFTAGGVRRNGDRYAPRWYYSGSPASNPDHNPDGYDYIATFGGSNGRVHLFDPVFCATGSNPAGSGNYGAGDHWTDLPAGGGTANGPVTTEFTLYDTKATVEKSDDTIVGNPLVYTSRASDQSGEFDNPDPRPITVPGGGGGPKAGDIPTGAPVTDCQDNPAIVAAHNKWVTDPTWTGLPAGMYRVNVKSSQAGNAATGAENLWSIYVGDNGPAGSARVFGEGRMLAYSNLTGTASTQKFYLTQIGKELAGKTMEIQLFDPGDVAGDATLRIKSPDGGVYTNVSFSYQADDQCQGGVSDSCAGSSQTSIRTAVGGASSFDNSVITIKIQLPTTYGTGSLKPAGETEDGWWKIEYEVGAANDTTTWEVTILENPVHLVVE